MLLSLTLQAQTPKENYVNAEELYYSGDYSSAITKLNAVQSSLGVSNAVVEQLRVKCYFEQEEWVKTEKHLKKFFSYKASKELSDEMLDYAQKLQDRTFKASQDKIKEEAKKAEQTLLSFETSINTQIKTIERENENIIKAANHDKELNKLAISLKAGIESDLDDFLYIEEGKPYLITSRKNLTSSSSERAVIIFYGNEYIIYTVPSVSITKKLYKDEVNYTSSDAQSGNVVINQKIDRYGIKQEMSYKKSIHYSNIFLGGWGDELIWTKGEQLVEFDQVLYYYYDNNILQCDVELNTSFSEHIYNPYIETGTISKTIDYDLVKDYSLSEKLEDAGVVNKTSYTLSNPEILKITLEPSDNIKMLFPEKRIKYKLADKIKGKYVNQNIEYKGDFLYFVPITKANHYGYIQYGTSYPKSIFVNSITGLNNNYRMSKSRFSSIYETFSESVGNGTIQYFTSTDYKSVFESIPSIIEGDETAIRESFVNSVFGDFDEFMKNFEDLNIDSKKQMFWKKTWVEKPNYHSIAWFLYENTNNSKQLELAISLVQTAIERNETYYNTDTYAALLYKTGNFSQALVVADRAIELAKVKNIDYSVTEELIEKIIKAKASNKKN
jgi:hypothetical protein